MRITLTLLLIFFVFACTKKKTQTEATPPPIAQFTYGADQDSLLSSFQASGFRIEKQDPTSLSMYLLYEAEKIAKEQGLSSFEEIKPYRIVLYFQNGKMNIFRIIRNEEDTKAAEFFEALKVQYNMGQAAYEDATEEMSATMSKIQHKTAIYKTSSMIVKCSQSRYEITEPKLQGGKNNELDCTFFSIKENEGITVEGLIPEKK